MSQAHAMRAAAPSWMGSLFHAAVGLVLFAVLLAGAVVYTFQVLTPEVLRNNQAEVVFQRCAMPLPDVGNPDVPAWLYLWVGAGLLSLVALIAGLWVLVRVYRQIPPASWIWGGVALTVLLLVPPILLAFQMPSVPKVPGGDKWWYITGAFLVLAFGYVGWMYWRDSRGVGPLWASLLGLLRATVFTLLALFFMLPAVHDKKETYSRSKVLLLFDVSNSMIHVKDDVPDEAHPLEGLPTRQDKVLAFLDGKADFLRRLEAKNPVDAFRMARNLDPDYLHFDQTNRVWTKAEYEAFLGQTLRQPAPRPEAPPPPAWALIWLALVAFVAVVLLVGAAVGRAFARRDRAMPPRVLTLIAAFTGSLFYLGYVVGRRLRSGAYWACVGGAVAAILLLAAFPAVALTSYFFTPPEEARPVAAEEPALDPQLWTAWLKPSTDVKPPDDAAQQERFRTFLTLNSGLIEKDADYLNNTNLGDSLLALVGSESKKMLQGIVVFTDGRSNEGSPTGFEQLKDDARREHIPIFVVAIGEERPQVKLDITDLRVPEQIQPDDKFPAMVEITGEGLPDQQAPVDLEVTYVHKNADGKEELLPILLRESVEEKPGQTVKKQETALPPRIVLHDVAKFDTGSPPRAEMQFQIDAAALAKAAGVDLSKPPFDKAHKWEIEETLPDAELRFRAHVPRAPKEVGAEAEHVSDPAGLVVQTKPLRVLLFASAATHEYQFLQAILVRDTDKDRVKVSAFLQPPPGQKEPREGVEQDHKMALLKNFPDQFDIGPDKKGDNPYDLSDYDVIVAFDPDWDQLTDKQIQLIFGRDEVDAAGQVRHVDGWVDKGGGFIYVAGPVNTVQLAGPREDEKRRFGPILDKLPVVLKDIRLEEVNRNTENAFPLDLRDATENLEFLKLEELTPDGKPVKFKDDWKDFFGPIQPDRTVGRGFYNFYPVESAKPTTQVAAYFGDPLVKSKNSKGEDSLMPFLVLSNPADPNTRVVWLGWGEMWRLRQKHEEYLERFWTKLTRYAGGLHHGKVVKRVTTNFGRQFTTGQPIVMEARIEGKGGEPLPDDAKPLVKITAPRIAPKMSDEMARELKQLEDRGGDLTAAQRVRKEQLQRTRDDDERQKQAIEDLQKDMIMTPKARNPGWFQVRFEAPVEGAYQMELTVNETGDKVPHKFTVKQSNPELDNTRPDFARMYETASYLDEDVQGRITSIDDLKELQQKLQRPKLEEGSQQDDRPRLYFNLANAGLIPKCMSSTENRDTHYSDPRVLWNENGPLQWLPWWLVAPLSLALTAGFLAGFFFFRSDRPTVPLEQTAGGRVLLGVFGLVSLGGFSAGRHLGLAGWALLVGGLVLLIAPLFLPAMIPLGWFAFPILIGLMSAEWLIRKLLRLA